MTIRSVLIANRGEIAVRVIRTCRDMGLETVAVFSEADAGQMWTRLADQSVCIGPSASSASYLNIEAIIAAAEATGAVAIHPGYGLLSESPEFAAAVRQAGLVFIGPSAEIVARMGDKVAARAAAVGSNVPVLPGSVGPVEDVEIAKSIAAELGWPVAVKASFGGGGRGMRVAESLEALEAAMQQAAREALGAFGRAETFLEKFLVRPRHVEVQVLGDLHGNVIHLGDRDCSVQRRHQKVIEEAPAPNLSDALREKIRAAAVRLARDVGYLGVGTVEFLVDREGEAFYFLEMNTRLQVEHGVTEMVTGIDLVAEQIRVASGQPLSLSQSDIMIRGHAMQARLTAEDAWDDFRPSPGRISELILPDGPWLRLDFGFEAGDSIPPFYDSLIGKVQAFGQTREDARKRLLMALQTIKVEGLPTTAPYLVSLLDQKAFIDVAHDTGMLQRDWMPLPEECPEPCAPSFTRRNAAVVPRPSRMVCIPWGGDIVDFTVFGIASNTQAAQAGHVRTRTDRRQSQTGAPVAGSDEVLSPLDATVVEIVVKVGETVEQGTPILVLEAMKMEVVVSAKRGGVLAAINVKSGDVVHRGAVLTRMAADNQVMPVTGSLQGEIRHD